MKEVIITKLFDDKSLTNEEILFIATHLKDGEDTDELKFNHSSGNVYDACGITEEEVSEIDKHVNDRMKEDGRISHAVELLEADILSSRRKLRCFVVTHLQVFPKIAGIRSFKDLGKKISGLLSKDDDTTTIININGKEVNLDNISDDLPDHIKEILKMLRDRRKGGK